MGHHRVKRGLDIPIAGRPMQTIESGQPVTRVALVADDYVGMRPSFRVQVGDVVRRGQVLFEDKKMPGVLYTAPAAGTITAIHRGDRRAFQSVVIELSEGERAGQPAENEVARFEAYRGQPSGSLDREQVKALLVESGLWTALRGRPFGRVADPGGAPRSIFVTAMDTNPLAGDVAVILEGRGADFQAGLEVVAKLTDGVVYVCKAPGSAVPLKTSEKIREETFEGPHPAGNVGLHMHLVDPVCRGKVVWHLNAQDVAAIGRLFSTGALDVGRVVALGGPVVRKPRLLATRIGGCLDELVAGELEGEDLRVVSGSVLSGRTAGGEVFGYLGRYHTQVTALKEGHQRELFGWVMPGADKYSSIRSYLAGFLPRRLFDMTTSSNGSERAIVPIGMYERVMPLDIQPTYLLRSLVARDVERAEQLGALELEEEDLALCSFVCPGKGDYGPILREVLDTIEKEG